jgi:hypothetical protein
MKLNVKCLKCQRLNISRGISLPSVAVTHFMSAYIRRLLFCAHKESHAPRFSVCARLAAAAFIAQTRSLWIIGGEEQTLEMRSRPKRSLPSLFGNTARVA